MQALEDHFTKIQSTVKLPKVNVSTGSPKANMSPGSPKANISPGSPKASMNPGLPKANMSPGSPTTSSKPGYPEKQHIFDNRMIRRAITLSAFALTEPDNYRPFGAVIVRDSDRKLLSECVSNTGKTKDPSAHGILLAVRDACKLLGKEALEDCTVYSSCEPCAMCSALIAATKLSRVVYGCSCNDVMKYVDFREAFEEVCKPIHERGIPAVCLAGKDAKDVIASWYRRDEQL